MALPSFVSTWLAVCLRPTAWFTQIRDQPRVGAAFAFAIGCALLAAVGGELTAMLTGNPPSFARFLLTPIATVVTLPLSAAVAHALFALFRMRSRPFAVTLAAGAWSTLPNAIAVVPVVGLIAASLWSAWLLLVGLSVVHATPKIRVFLVGVIVPPVVAVAAALGLRVFVLEAFKIPSGSMQPTLLIGDHLFVRKSAYRFGDAPQPGDVIVFEFPENRTQDFVKRVVAVGGDTVSVEDGTPVVNGRRTSTCKAGIHVAHGETTVRQSVEVEQLGDRRYLTLHDVAAVTRAPSFGPFTVPAGQYFVLGDNRDNAYDSRGWFRGRGAAVPRDHVKGRAWLIWLSLATGGAGEGRGGLRLDRDPVAPADYEPDVIEGVKRCLLPGAVFAPR